MEISSLKDELEKWYENNCKNGNLAWSNLAKISGVSTSNIRKIAKGEVERPRYDTARKLCTALFPNKSDITDVYLKEMYPNQAQTWFVGNSERAERVSDGFDITRDIDVYVLFKLAMTKKAKTADLRQLYGNNLFSKKMKILTEANLAEETPDGRLVRSEGARFTKNSDVHSLADEFRLCATIAETKIAANAAGAQQIDRIANRFDFLHLGVNEEGSAKIDKELESFKEKLYIIYTDPKFKGEIPRFVNLLVGRFDDK